MSLPPDTSQGVADALGYLQHHLHELTERQNVSKNNINTTLAALTAQLQQLTQLVANPPPPPISNTPPLPVPSPLASPPPAPTVRQMHPKLSCPPDFGRERHNGRAFLKLLLPIHPSGPGTVPQRKGEDSLGPHVLQKWSCCQVVRKHISSGSGHWRFPHPNLERLRAIIPGSLLPS